MIDQIQLVPAVAAFVLFVLSMLVAFAPNEAAEAEPIAPLLGARPRS